MSSGPVSSTVIWRDERPTIESWMPGKSWYRTWIAMTPPMGARSAKRPSAPTGPFSP